ncbi:hypothetical protein ES703_18609 [subsurface metagenome]
MWHAVDYETDVAIAEVGPSPALANLYGFIHDTKGDPLAAVSVAVNEHTTATLLDGIFSLLDLDPREYTITCTKVGYQDFTTTKTLEQGDNEIDITMLAEGEAPPEEIPWLWIGIGSGAVIAILAAVALAKRRKK